MLRWIVFLLLAGVVAWIFGFGGASALADYAAEILAVIGILCFFWGLTVGRHPKEPTDERIA